MGQYARYAGGPATTNIAATHIPEPADRSEKLKAWTPRAPKAPPPKRRNANPKNLSLVNLLARCIAVAVLGVAMLCALHALT